MSRLVLQIVGYNLDNNRGTATVEAELNTLAGTLADVIAYCEGAGYDAIAARIPGYDLHTRRGKGPSARDAGLLTRHGVNAHGFRLARTHARWRRDKNPSKWHWPRSFPSVVVDGVRVVSVHMPRQTHPYAYAVCWLRLLSIAASTRRPLVLVGDWNKGLHAEGPFTPSLLARLGGFRTIGRGIDGALYRGGVARDLEYADGYGSDHKPFRFILEVHS